MTGSDGGFVTSKSISDAAAGGCKAAAPVSANRAGFADDVVPPLDVAGVLSDVGGGELGLLYEPVEGM